MKFETTLGTFAVELDGARAPLSTANFLQYVRDGHYDGTIFHRVIGNFVVQGGGYLPDGTEKPVRRGDPQRNRQRPDEPPRHAGARAHDDPHSAAAQFYVNIIDNLGSTRRRITGVMPSSAGSSRAWT